MVPLFSSPFQHARTGQARFIGYQDEARLEPVFEDDSIGIATGEPLKLILLSVNRDPGLADMVDGPALIGVCLDL